MNQAAKAQLAELDLEIERMRAAGNRVGQAAVHSHKALLYALSMDMRSAAREMTHAGTLAEKEWRFEDMAATQLTRGKSLMHHFGQHKAARTALHKAASLYHTLGNYVHEAEALKALASLDIGAHHFKCAIARLNRAIVLLGGSDKTTLAVELHWLRARCHVLRRDLESALTDLNTALNLAQQGGNSTLALQVWVERQATRQLLSTGLTGKQFAALLQKAQVMANLQGAGDIQLQRAIESFQSGRYRQALEQAQAARQLARDASDHTKHGRYLLSSLLIAEAEEKSNNRPGVLVALLTCKIYLGTHLGQEVNRHMNVLLDELKLRWGREGLAEAIRGYQQQVQQQGLYQV